ncbi:hypothetical protein [Cupriavidus plantarum]|uniref:hypothetical protein n=1 Tax=Cupriavidus plantarum TaxID=942865 RepID=UPI0011C01E11|nr:hypothetical protein [Cupriavidus plantarum]
MTSNKCLTGSVMRDTNDQIGRLLRALHQNDDLIAAAFSGGLELGAHNARIDALSNLRALKPFDEGIYRLNPRLRDFIADHLVSYRAFQALTRLSGPIQQARALWREMKFRHDDEEPSDRDALFEQFIDAVMDIAYSIERNLSLLHSLVSTQYGDVSSFSAKLRQNKYYIREIGEALNEMAQVDRLVEDIDGEALTAGLPEVRAIVRRRLTSRLLAWTSQIKDAQASINRSLFKARRLEERVRKLSRVSHWLRQNRSASGFEVGLDNAPETLFLSEPLALRAHIDVRGARETEHEMLCEAIARLPARDFERPAEVPPPPVAILEDEGEAVIEPLEPHDAMIEALLEDLRGTSQGISLRMWKEAQVSDFDLLSVEEWLLYASIQLENEGIRLTFLPIEGAPTRYSNEISDDVIAQGMA